jgi:hypothetical protein
MPRSILLLLLPLLWCRPAAGQATNPFAKLKFDKVMMYDFNGGKGEDLSIINPSGRLAASVTKQVQLSPAETSRFTSRIGSRRSYGGSTASCFDPHLGFVYYLNGKSVAHITVCLDCNRLRAVPDIPARKQGKAGSGKDAYYLSDGLSKSLRQYLNGLIKANSFSHQLP